jgi:hypothetical protein
MNRFAITAAALTFVGLGLAASWTFGWLSMDVVWACWIGVVAVALVYEITRARRK